MTTTSNAAEGAMDWPDGPARRLALGHADERDVPGYCTCGELASACPVLPREWMAGGVLLAPSNTAATMAGDARHLAELHAAAVAADRRAGQETSAATVQASLDAHHELDEACEVFRRRHFPRSKRVVAAYGEVFTLSPTGQSIRLVWSDR